MKKERMTGALFDLDGVLIDTEGIYTEFWAEMGRKFNVGVENFAQKIKGCTLASILSTYFPDTSVQKEIIQYITEHERDMRYTVFDGIYALLDNLRQHGFSIAIVTSSNGRKMENLFRQLPDLQRKTDIVITDEYVTHSKPDPEGYLLAAHRLGIPIEQCYVFEDSINGLRAGRNAGAVVVGIATTNPRSAIAPLSDIVLDNTADFQPKE